jgi:hypothetical protein
MENNSCDSSSNKYIIPKLNMVESEVNTLLNANTQGATGPTGIGSNIIVGSGQPILNQGNPSDLYINNTTKELYQRVVTGYTPAFFNSSVRPFLYIRPTMPLVATSILASLFIDNPAFKSFVVEAFIFNLFAPRVAKTLKAASLAWA